MVGVVVDYRVFKALLVLEEIQVRKEQQVLKAQMVLDYLVTKAFKVQPAVAVEAAVETKAFKVFKALMDCKDQLVLAHQDRRAFKVLLDYKVLKVMLVIQAILVRKVFKDHPLLQVQQFKERKAFKVAMAQLALASKVFKVQQVFKVT